MENCGSVGSGSPREGERLSQSIEVDMSLLTDALGLVLVVLQITAVSLEIKSNRK